MATTNLTPPQLAAKDIKRFWSKVRRVDDVLACWEWYGGIWLKYGRLKIRPSGRFIRSHRLAFYLITGEWPDFVMHACDNPPCCNPLHLRAGDCVQNNADRKAKGRSLMGERSPQAKLTSADVRKIRADLITNGGRLANLAREYGITREAVWAIKVRKNWKYLG